MYYFCNVKKGKEMKYSELKRKLTAAGCYFVKQKSNHEWWFSPVNGRYFPIQRHGNMEIGRELLRQLEKETGVSL